MSEHIHVLKIKKELIDKIDFNDVHVVTLATKYKAEFAEFNGRLDSIGKRLSNIINTGKKLSNYRFPVIVKNKTLKNYFVDESNYWGEVIKNMAANNEDENSFYFSFVVKWKKAIDETIKFIDNVKDDEILIITI